MRIMSDLLETSSPSSSPFLIVIHQLLFHVSFSSVLLSSFFDVTVSIGSLCVCAVFEMSSDSNTTNGCVLSIAHLGHLNYVCESPSPLQ